MWPFLFLPIPSTPPKKFFLQIFLKYNKYKLRSIQYCCHISPKAFQNKHKMMNE
ncbi:unnamed protein product [Meloidogyne enterolobii]|uniref:Uncharacterized protein n=1 Tax=Meloidogyne enterolobii TaxID=390850 RepID=A0ACB0XX79_MELEN